MTAAHEHPEAALPIGTEIGHHTIEAVIATGPSGFVYLASDAALGRQVAIKEYFPPTLAVRHAGTQLKPRSAGQHAAIIAGRQAFADESRLLAQVARRSLVPVLGGHEANQTLYRVMPFFHPAPTLGQAVAERGGPPGDEAWLRSMVADLLAAFETLHEAGLVHGYVHPDQVLLLPDGRPLLLGFGAATRALHLASEDAFTPPELGTSGPAMRRGAWTDLYGLAALAWFAAAGEPPPAERPVHAQALLDSAFGAAADAAAARSRERLAYALTRALEPLPTERVQGAAQFRAMFEQPPEGEASLPEEADPKVRAAIAAAVAAIPDREKVDAPAAERPTAARPLASPAPSVTQPATQATPPPAERRGMRPPPVVVPPAPSPAVSAERPTPDVTAPPPRWRSRPAPVVVPPAPAAPPAWGPRPVPVIAVEPPAAPAEAPDWTAERAPAARAQKRASGAWTWAAAVLLGVICGAAAWRWSDRLGGAPSQVAERPPAAEFDVPAARPGQVPPPAVAATTSPPPVADLGDSMAAPAAGPPATPVEPNAVTRDARPPIAAAPSTTRAPAGNAARAPAGHAARAPGANAAQAPAEPAREAVAVAPAQAPPRPAVDPEGAAPPARASAARRSTTAAATSKVPATPRAVCGNRENFSLVWCMQHQCLRPEFSSHPQCRELRRTGEVS